MTAHAQLHKLVRGLSLTYMFEGASMQVSKWGNSLAIRLPVAVVEAWVSGRAMT